MKDCFIIIQTSNRMQFFTILQDNLHSFSIQDRADKHFSSLIQDDRSTYFLCTTNYRIDHILKRFHEENSIEFRVTYKSIQRFVVG